MLVMSGIDRSLLTIREIAGVTGKPGEVAVSVWLPLDIGAVVWNDHRLDELATTRPICTPSSKTDTTLPCGAVPVIFGRLPYKESPEVGLVMTKEAVSAGFTVSKTAGLKSLILLGSV